MPAMSGDVCALKGRLLQMSVADVRGAGLSFKRAVRARSSRSPAAHAGRIFPNGNRRRCFALPVFFC